MSNRIRILPYKQGSKSAKALATALGGKVLRLNGSTFVAGGGDRVINWGCSNANVHPGIAIAQTLWEEKILFNKQDTIQQASNKLSFFNLMENEGLLDLIPEYWTDKEAIPSEAYPVLCRTILTGHSGAGIHWADTPDDLVDAPLYVKYVKKSEEYRVHRCSSSGTFLVQRKARRLDHDSPDWRIRNHQNGFIYQREDVDAPMCVYDAAADAFNVTELDFGAVDVIYNKTKDKAYVLEINTAPGLAGSTVTDYANMIKEMI